MGMGEKNTKLFLQLFAFWMTILFLALVFLTSCSEYNSDMRVVWSTSVQNLDEPYGDTWEEREIEEPVKCREGETYYVDPYTEVEYCLPAGFSNMAVIHFYKIER